MDYSTGNFQDLIERCESTQEFKEILNLLHSQKEEWTRALNGILEREGLSVSVMARKCGVSRQAVMKWQKGSIPKSRDMYIRIALAAGYELEQVNNFLKRFGRCQELYAKSLEDSVYIFILSSDHIERSYQSYLKITEELRAAMEMSVRETETETNWETGAYFQKLSDIKTVAELTEFVERHAKVYKQQYHKLYSYIKLYIANNLLTDESAKDSIYALAERQQWSASLRTCVSQINQKKWYPQRNKLISLGIHLNMDADQINYMLELAHMCSLYPKNPFEGAIIFALVSAELEDFVGLTGSDLCWYVRSVLEALDYTDIEFFLEELPEGVEDIF